MLPIVDVGQGKQDDLPQEASKRFGFPFIPGPGPGLTRAVVRLTWEDDDERPWKGIG